MYFFSSLRHHTIPSTAGDGGCLYWVGREVERQHQASRRTREVDVTLGNPKGLRSTMFNDFWGEYWSLGEYLRFQVWVNIQWYGQQNGPHRKKTGSSLCCCFLKERNFLQGVFLAPTTYTLASHVFFFETFSELGLFQNIFCFKVSTGIWKKVIFFSAEMIFLPDFFPF